MYLHFFPSEATVLGLLRLQRIPCLHAVTYRQRCLTCQHIKFKHPWHTWKYFIWKTKQLKGKFTISQVCIKTILRQSAVQWNCFCLLLSTFLIRSCKYLFLMCFQCKWQRKSSKVLVLWKHTLQSLFECSFSSQSLTDFQSLESF